jgi:hypothetical protein
MRLDNEVEDVTEESVYSGCMVPALLNRNALGRESPRSPARYNSSWP